jgi:hypothetical protein
VHTTTKLKDALAIVATCVLAGPAFALLIIYLCLLGISVWVGAVAYISGGPHAGAGMLAGAMGTGMLFMPMFALVGIFIAAPLTVLTGFTLAVVHCFAIAEHLASRVSAVSLAFIRFTLNVLVSLAVIAIAAPESAWATVAKLGPLSLIFAAGVSGAACASLALAVRGKFMIGPGVRSQHAG